MKRITSPARAAASRANGLKTRGPVTPSGKYNSSRNATRHGILAHCLVMNGELPELFEELYTRFNADLRPRTDVERALVEDMVTSWWRKQRVWGMESARIQYQAKMNQAMGRLVDVDDPATITALAVGDLADNSRVLDLCLRYEIHYGRQFHRALNRLLDLRSRDPEPDDDPDAGPEPATATQPATPPITPPTDIRPSRDREGAVDCAPKNAVLPNDPEQLIENTTQLLSGSSASPAARAPGVIVIKGPSTANASARNAPAGPPDFERKPACEIILSGDSAT